MGVKSSAFTGRLKRCSGPCARQKLEIEFWDDSKTSDGKMSRCIDCTKQARKLRAEARQEGRPLPTITDERRQELSERAKRLHSQGLLGGPEYGRLGGRPKKIRIADAVIEHFRQDPKVELIIRAYESNLRSNSKAGRLRAAEALVAMESRDDELKAKLRGAGKKPEDMDPEELQSFLEQALTGMIQRGEIDTAGLIVESTARDMEIA